MAFGFEKPEASISSIKPNAAAGGVGGWRTSNSAVASSWARGMRSLRLLFGSLPVACVPLTMVAGELLAEAGVAAAAEKASYK